MGFMDQFRPQAPTPFSKQMVGNRLDAMGRSIEDIELSLPDDISDAVSDALPGAFPPIGSYLMSDTDPGLHYGSTTWTQAGTITADGNVAIQIWKRTA